MKRVVLTILCFSFLTAIVAQQDIVVYPTHWWVGMKNQKLQLMLHETDKNKILAVEKLVVRSSSPDVEIVKVNKVENNRYLFIDLEIASTAKPQKLTFSLGGVVASEWRKIDFELKPRRKGNGSQYAQGVRSEDFIYLIMP